MITDQAGWQTPEQARMAVRAAEKQRRENLQTVQEELAVIPDQIRLLAGLLKWEKGYLDRTLKAHNPEITTSRDTIRLDQFTFNVVDERGRGRTQRILNALAPALDGWKEDLIALRAGSNGFDAADPNGQRIGDVTDENAKTVDQLKQRVEQSIVQLRALKPLSQRNW